MPDITSSRRDFIRYGSAVMLLAGGCGHAAARETGSWVRGPDLPEPVQEIYPCHHKGRIHLAGGFVATNGRITGPTAAHISLDPADGLWRSLAGLPQARHHPQLISYRETLHAIGGFASAPDAIWQMQPTVWQYDDAAESWAEGPPLPAPNGESVTVVLGDHLHIAGGRHPKGSRNRDWTDHIDTDRHWRFDGTVWTEAALLPTPRNSAAGAVLNGRWHVVGGRTVEGGNLPTHEVYEPQADRWDVAAPMPQAQGGLAAASLGGKLYAFGGEYFDNGGGVYAECWAYEPTLDTWERLPDMPNPRHGLGGVSMGSDIYVIGGALKAGGNETSQLVEIFRPASA